MLDRLERMNWRVVTARAALGLVLVAGLVCPPALGQSSSGQMLVPVTIQHGSLSQMVNAAIPASTVAEGAWTMVDNDSWGIKYRVDREGSGGASRRTSKRLLAGDSRVASQDVSLLVEGKVDVPGLAQGFETLEFDPGASGVTSGEWRGTTRFAVKAIGSRCHRSAAKVGECRAESAARRVREGLTPAARLTSLVDFSAEGRAGESSWTSGRRRLNARWRINSREFGDPSTRPACEAILQFALAPESAGK
jgi:hypothetical protein